MTTAQQTIDKIKLLGWEIISHPQYLPNFNLLRSLDKKELKNGFSNFFGAKPGDFFGESKIYLPVWL